MQEAGNFDFEFVDGVVKVWTDESREQEVCAPPGSAVDYFSGGAVSGYAIWFHLEKLSNRQHSLLLLLPPAPPLQTCTGCCG